MKWINAKKKLPSFGKDVIVYRTDEVSRRPFIDLMYRSEREDGYWDWYGTYNRDLYLKSTVLYWTEFIIPKDDDSVKTSTEMCEFEGCRSLKTYHCSLGSQSFFYCYKHVLEIKDTHYDFSYPDLVEDDE